MYRDGHDAADRSCHGCVEHYDDDRDGQETVTFDGSASDDPDGGIVAHDWYEGSELLATGATATVPLPVGPGSSPGPRARRPRPCNC